MSAAFIRTPFLLNLARGRRSTWGNLWFSDVLITRSGQSLDCWLVIRTEPPSGSLDLDGRKGEWSRVLSSKEASLRNGTSLTESPPIPSWNSFILESISRYFFQLKTPVGKPTISTNIWPNPAPAGKARKVTPFGLLSRYGNHSCGGRRRVFA